MKRACIWLIATLWLVLMAGCASRPEKPVAVPVSPGSKPTAKSGSGSKMSAKDIQAITAYHDKVRADVGVGSMKWSPTLAVYAQQWADKYTQMVWRDTTALGCGEAICDKTLIVACNYDPPGNYIGRRPY